MLKFEGLIVAGVIAAGMITSLNFSTISVLAHNATSGNKIAGGAVNATVAQNARFVADLNRKGALDLNVGDWNSAVIDFKKALEIDPKNVTALYGVRQAMDLATTNGTMPPNNNIPPAYR